MGAEQSRRWGAQREGDLLHAAADEVLDSAFRSPSPGLEAVLAASGGPRDRLPARCIHALELLEKARIRLLVVRHLSPTSRFVLTCRALRCAADDDYWRGWLAGALEAQYAPPQSPPMSLFNPSLVQTRSGVLRAQQLQLEFPETSPAELYRHIYRLARLRQTDGWLPFVLSWDGESDGELSPTSLLRRLGAPDSGQAHLDADGKHVERQFSQGALASRRKAYLNGQQGSKPLMASARTLGLWLGQCEPGKGHQFVNMFAAVRSHPRLVTGFTSGTFEAA